MTFAGLLLALCTATPATAQTVAGCGTTTPTKAEAASIPKLTLKADCFAKAGTAASKAEQVHRAAIVAAAPKPVEPKYWIDCAKETETCRVPSATRVRYGAAGKFAYRDTTTAIGCGNGTFGDPAPGIVKTCAYGSATPAPVMTPAPSPIATPLPAPVSTVTGKPAAARDRLGLNVAGLTYYGGEPIYANQLYGLRWLVNWQGIDARFLRPDGFPIAVDGTAAAPVVTSILNPPATAKTTDDATTICRWEGNGEVSLGGNVNKLKHGDHSVQFTWTKSIKEDGGRMWLSIMRSNAADPVRAMDCRLTTEARDLVFAPSVLSYLKPFGVLRFLDQSAANGNPPSVTWATRSVPGDLIQRGTDNIAIENMVALANANGSSPWFTVPWNADADYHRRMAQLVHDSVPAGKPVYVEISNEVWNYSFGQAGQAQTEGLAAGLSDNAFQANIRRLAQKTIEIMPIWAEVYKDRPADLVRVIATQADNAWVGGNLFEFDNGAIAKNIDAVAIAPYFKIDTDKLVANHATNMTALAAEAKRQVAFQSAAYKTLTDKWGKRLIAYEGGQHQIDPDNQARLEAMNRDPAMEGIYRQYLTDWQALTGDLFVLYSATGPFSKYGAWGLREYAGQPLSETPKLRGVLDFADTQDVPK
ncbi:hypothetical protein ASG67_10430 [Sphingomonas sp. Leaf339]|nr:hypothetical protein ASG67_10430 [Sphingomonas sp. Leaf339]